VICTQAGGQSHAASFVLCRRRRRAHPPARPSSRVECPVGYPDPPPQAPGPGARVCGCGCSRCAWWCLVRTCGSTPSYEQRPRDSCLCNWGGRHLCSAPVCAALGQASLAVWFAGPRMSGAAKAAGGAPLLAAARRRLGGGGRRPNGLLPPLAAICSDVMAACLDHYFLSTSDSVLLAQTSE
jgi:hypothetical protein